MVAFFILIFIFSPCAHAADPNFYTLNKKWERTAASDVSKEEAVDRSFRSALSEMAPAPLLLPTPPSKDMSFAQIAASGNSVEIQQGQVLIVRADGIVKYVATAESIVAFEQKESNALHILGAGFGRTFVHLWDAGGRHTFEVRVIPQKYAPSKRELERMEDLNRSRSFEFGYDNSRSSTHTAAKFSELQRSSLDFLQKFKLTGDTPHGRFSSHAQFQKSGRKNVLTDAQIALKDGRIGPLRNFDLTLVDFNAKPDFLVFPDARLRGIKLDHWDDPGRVRWHGFYGREGAGFLGPISPGLLTERTRDSFLSGGILDFQLNPDARVESAYFNGFGQNREDLLNRDAFAVKSDIRLGPVTRFKPEIDFDNEHVAHKEEVTVTFERFRARSQWRDISKKFVTMIGNPSAQGEIGNLFEFKAEPSERLSFEGSLDIFRDRLIPNPANEDRLNFHTDLSMNYVPWDRANARLFFQNLDDTGRLGPTKQRMVGSQYTQSFNFLGHPVSGFVRYHNRGYRILTNSALNYIQDQFTLGFQTPLFWGINFSLQEEWNWLAEPNLDRFSRPRALTAMLNHSDRVWETPLYLDWNLRIRDEEETESVNSFMIGEDSAEVSATLSYREIPEWEIYATAGLQQFVPESLNVTSPRVEAHVFTGMRTLIDTGYRWSPVGAFEGFVFKDTNGDGEREPGEPGLPEVVVRASGGREAKTDAQGFYELKRVPGKTATVSLDLSNIPYGHVPTTPLAQTVPVIHQKTQFVNFGFAPHSEIAGTVFNDLNGNGQYDALQDSGVAKVRLLLEDQRTVRTGGQGIYAFSNVTAGEHLVSLDLSSLPEGYLPIGSVKKTVTLFEGIRYELNFPLRALRAVAGRVFLDTNANGHLDHDETGLAGVRVLLGNQSMTSDKEGWYLFDRLPAGRQDLSAGPSTLPPDSEAGAIEIDLSDEPVTLKNKHLPVKKRSL